MGDGVRGGTQYRPLAGCYYAVLLKVSASGICATFDRRELLDLPEPERSGLLDPMVYCKLRCNIQVIFSECPSIRVGKVLLLVVYVM